MKRTRKKYFPCKGFTLVELMFAIAIFSMISASIYITLITFASRVSAINEISNATTAVSLFEKELGRIIMPSQEVQFRDASNNPLPFASAPDADKDAIFFNVLDGSLNWVWMKIWYDPATTEVWLDPNINAASTPKLLLSNIERFDYINDTLRGDDPLFDIKVGGNAGKFYVNMNISYIFRKISQIEGDPIRLRITKYLRNQP